MDSKTQEIIKKWDYIMKDPILSISSIKNKAFHGKLREEGLRSLCWKIFLNYLPNLETSTWQIEMDKERQHYEDLKNKFIFDPNKKNKGEVDWSINNPLSLEEESPWKKYFEDTELQKTIMQDVERTFPDISFFREENVQSMMCNILFIYCKLNQDISYRQGMHEILAPILLVVDNDKIDIENKTINNDLIENVLSAKYVEHDSFFLFCQVMKGARPWYEFNETISTPVDPLKEKFVIPIVAKCQRIQNELLKVVDKELFEALKGHEIEPQLYGLRWLRLLFGREFPLNQVLTLWDGIFAEENNLELVDWIVIAMLMYIRENIINQEYSVCLTSLMKYPKLKSEDEILLFIENARKLKNNWVELLANQAKNEIIRNEIITHQQTQHPFQLLPKFQEKTIPWISYDKVIHKSNKDPHASISYNEINNEEVDNQQINKNKDIKNVINIESQIIEENKLLNKKIHDIEHTMNTFNVQLSYCILTASKIKDKYTNNNSTEINKDDIIKDYELILESLNKLKKINGEIAIKKININDNASQNNNIKKSTEVVPNLNNDKQNIEKIKKKNIIDDNNKVQNIINENKSKNDINKENNDVINKETNKEDNKKINDLHIKESNEEINIEHIKENNNEKKIMNKEIFDEKLCNNEVKDNKSKIININNKNAISILNIKTNTGEEKIEINKEDDNKKKIEGSPKEESNNYEKILEANLEKTNDNIVKEITKDIINNENANIRINTNTIPLSKEWKDETLKDQFDIQISYESNNLDTNYSTIQDFNTNSIDVNLNNNVWKSDNSALSTGNNEFSQLNINNPWEDPWSEPKKEHINKDNNHNQNENKKNSTEVIEDKKYINEKTNNSSLSSAIKKKQIANIQIETNTSNNNEKIPEITNSKKSITKSNSKNEKLKHELDNKIKESRKILFNENNNEKHTILSTHSENLFKNDDEDILEILKKSRSNTSPNLLFKKDSNSYDKYFSQSVPSFSNIKSNSYISPSNKSYSENHKPKKLEKQNSVNTNNSRSNTYSGSSSIQGSSINNYIGYDPLLSPSLNKNNINSSLITNGLSQLPPLDNNANNKDTKQNETIKPVILDPLGATVVHIRKFN